MACWSLVLTSNFVLFIYLGEDTPSEKRRRAQWAPDIVLVGTDSLSASKQNLAAGAEEQHYLWWCWCLW
jgi:hypothetical protein